MNEIPNAVLETQTSTNNQRPVLKGGPGRHWNEIYLNMRNHNSILIAHGQGSRQFILLALPFSPVSALMANHIPESHNFNIHARDTSAFSSLRRVQKKIAYQTDYLTVIIILVSNSF